MISTRSNQHSNDIEVGAPKTGTNCQGVDSPPSIGGGTPKRNGLASIFASLSFVIGFALFSTVLVDLSDDDQSSLEELKVVQDNEKVYYLSNMILYICFGFAQLILTIGMAHSSLKTFPSVSMVGLALGIVWSTLVLAAGMVGNVGAKECLDLLKSDPEAAATLWKVIRTIHSGLGGGNEVVGGAWVLVATWSNFKARGCQDLGLLDKITFGIANVAGWAGLLSTVPIVAESCAVVFGVSMILWYALFGVLLIVRSYQNRD